MTNLTFCDSCSNGISPSMENISNTKLVWEFEFPPENPSEDTSAQKPMPGASQSNWLEKSVYHKHVLPIAMPLLIALALINNSLVLAVTACSTSFRRRTFASTRLLIGAVACCDIGIVIITRVPLVIGM